MSAYLTRSGAVATSPFIRVDLVRQVANVAPIFPPARYADGFAALKNGQYTDAVMHFREALAGDPLSGSDAIQASVREGSTALRQGQLTMAIARLESAVAAESNDSEIHRLLGMAYWADDQYEHSVEQFNAAIHLRPDDERSRVALADVLVSAGQSSEGEQAFKDAIQAVPRSGLARYRLGRLYDSQLRWAEAAQMFQAAVALNPVVGLDYLYQTIAREYLSQPDFDKAIAAASRQIEVNPNNGEAHRSLGDMYLRNGRHDEALTELLAALLINPSSAESYGGLAQVDLTTGRYAEAVVAARRALELDPRNSAAQYALATALIRLDQTDEGTRELERFQEMQRAAQAREQRDLEVKMLQQEASTSLTKEDYATAIAALQKVVSFEPAAPAAYLTLGVVLKKAGRQREAIDSLTRAADLDAGPDAYRLLAETYEAIGQAEESQKHRAAYERMKAERLTRSGWSR